MATASVISLIHSYTPHLIGLDLSYPRDVFSLQAELHWAYALAKFRDLKYLSIEVSIYSSGESHELSREFQRELVAAWHEACASLESVSFGSQLQSEIEFGSEMNISAMVSNWEWKKGNWVCVSVPVDDLRWRWQPQWPLCDGMPSFYCHLWGTLSVPLLGVTR